MGLAREQIGDEVRRLTSWREHTPVHTEEDVPETPPTEWVQTLGDEILDYYEPDEDLKVEDVLPDLDVPTPEAVAETDELRWCTHAALAGIPDRWRRALLLRYVDGLTGADLARAMGQPEADVERVLGHASEHLRQRLVESGCRVREADAHPHGHGRAETPRTDVADRVGGDGPAVTGPRTD
jgi:RNA polymerase sigma factor (sigma-70 family)